MAVRGWVDVVWLELPFATDLSRSSFSSTIMAEVSTIPPAQDAMQGVLSAGQPPLPTELSNPAAETTPAPPAEPEYASETLYIQNLNEKIKIDGIAPFILSAR